MGCLRTGCGTLPSYRRARSARDKRSPEMKKVRTVAAKASRNFLQPTLTIGLDLGDRNSWYCVLDEAGQTVGAASADDSESIAGSVRRDAAQCVALEIGTHSPWIIVY